MVIDPVIALPIFINRVTELLKTALIDRQVSEKWSSEIVLLVSFIIGAVSVVFVFPSTNFVQGLGASPLAEQIVTGIILGGLANGVNFVGQGATAVINRIAPKA